MEENTNESIKNVDNFEKLSNKGGDGPETKNDENPAILTKTRRVRKRPRTNAIRKDLKNRLEAAILSSESEVRGALQTRGEDGVLKAPLLEVLSRLKLLDNSQIANLSAFAFKSISNVTRVFKITEEPGNVCESGTSDQKLPPKTSSGIEDLWICVEPRICAHSDEKTVYVDNLPPQCSEAKLRRRALVFGSVAKVFLPQIPRIQKCIGSTLNSGFGFVQFVSKTAAKRFCKRYAASSRLKRAKHGGHHHKKKPSGAPADQNDDANALEESGGDVSMDDYDANPVVYDRENSMDLASILEFDYASRLAMEEEIRREAVEENNSLSRNELEKCSRKREASSPLVTESNKSIPGEASIGEEEALTGPLPKRRRSATDDVAQLTSVASSTSETIESSIECKNNVENEPKEVLIEDTVENESRSRNLSVSMYDSGNDTETENPLLAKRQSQNPDSATVGKETEKKRRRKRRRRSPSAGGGHGAGSLTNMLRRIQVFPLKQYRELRAEYLKLKKERVATLKQQILQAEKMGDEEKAGPSDAKMTIHNNERAGNSGGKKTAQKRRRNRRRPGGGRARIFKKAERIKSANFFDLKEVSEILTE